MLCASLELLDLGGDNEGFNSGQQVLAAGMRCSACNRVVGFILHHLGVKGAVKLLIAVLGHLVPSSCCWGCRRGQGKMLCVSEACRVKAGGEQWHCQRSHYAGNGSLGRGMRRLFRLPLFTHHLLLPAQEKRKVSLSVVWASYSNWTRYSELQVIPAEEM